MKLTKCFTAIGLMTGILFAGALPAKAKLTPCKKSTGDEIKIAHCHPYLGGSRSPGDSVGMTGLEYQANGGCEKRIYVDDSFQVHVLWMKVPFPFSSMAQRRMEWNFRYNDGSYFGEVDASPFTSGYGSLDLTQDAAVADQRTVISYHFNTGTNAYYPFYDVDAGNGFGSLPNDPQSPNVNNMLWAMVAATKSGNYILVTDDMAGNFHHCWVTTDNGTTWTNPFNSDSCASISQFIMASRLSNKVGCVEIRFITDSLAAGQLDGDVWYRVSTDGGVTWGPNTNLTHYQPADTFRAYVSVSCNFDQNDNFHVVWAARMVKSGEYYDASKILHWDEVHDTITVVSHSTGLFEGGWWGWTHPNGFGAWRLPADDPLLSYNPICGRLYCFWCGQADTMDVSQGGYPNGDIYGAWSADGGLTWCNWFNITNTHTPGAAAGACEDEDYLAVCPYAKRDSFYLTYVEDKDAGAITQTEGDTTDNIVRVIGCFCWHCNIEVIGNHENKQLEIIINPEPTRYITHISYKLPHTSEISLKLFDISGQLVKIVDHGRKEPGNYRVKVNLSGLSSGTYFVVLKDGEITRTAKLVKAR